MFKNTNNCAKRKTFLFCKKVAQKALKMHKVHRKLLKIHKKVRKTTVLFCEKKAPKRQQKTQQKNKKSGKNRYN